MLVVKIAILALASSASVVLSQEFNSSSLPEAGGVMNVTEEVAAKVTEEVVKIPETGSVPVEEQPQQDAPQSEPPTPPSEPPTRVPAKTTEVSTFPPLVHQDETSASTETGTTSETTPKPAATKETTKKHPEASTTPGASQGPKKGSSGGLMPHTFVVMLSFAFFVI